MFPQRLNSTVAYDTAKAMIDGFNQHYQLFRTQSSRAQQRFEVTTKILHRSYCQNDFIFVRPAISTEYIENEEPTARPAYRTNFRIQVLACARLFWYSVGPKNVFPYGQKKCFSVMQGPACTG